MTHSSTSGTKGRHATWKMDLQAPTTDNGTSTSPTPPPPPSLSPVLYNFYTKELADLISNGLSRVLTLADDGINNKTASDTHTALIAVQEQLEKVSQWYQETESEINPSKAQALWCTLNSKTVGQAFPAVSFNGEVIERTNNPKYVGIHFGRMLTYKTQVESTKFRCKKGLSALKAMAAKDIELRHLFLLYQSVTLSITDYCLGLTTLSQSSLLKEGGKRSHDKCMCYPLDLPSVETRQKVEQVKAYLTAMQNPKNSLLDAVKEERGRRLASHVWARQNSESSMRVA